MVDAKTKVRNKKSEVSVTVSAADSEVCVQPVTVLFRIRARLYMMAENQDSSSLEPTQLEYVMNIFSSNSVHTVQITSSNLKISNLKISAFSSAIYCSLIGLLLGILCIKSISI